MVKWKKKQKTKFGKIDSSYTKKEREKVTNGVQGKKIMFINMKFLIKTEIERNELIRSSRGDTNEKKRKERRLGK